MGRRDRIPAGDLFSCQGSCWCGEVLRAALCCRSSYRWPTTKKSRLRVEAALERSWTWKSPVHTVESASPWKMFQAMVWPAPPCDMTRHVSRAALPCFVRRSGCVIASYRMSAKYRDGHFVCECPAGRHSRIVRIVRLDCGEVCVRHTSNVTPRNVDHLYGVAGEVGRYSESESSGTFVQRNWMRGEEAK